MLADLAKQPVTIISLVENTLAGITYKNTQKIAKIRTRKKLGPHGSSVALRDRGSATDLHDDYMYVWHSKRRGVV